MPKKKKIIQKRRKKSSSMWIDGVLYTSTALFIFSQGYFTGEDAYKYINPYILFWIKYIIGSCAAISAGLKAYRSTSFADSR